MLDSLATTVIPVRKLLRHNLLPNSLHALIVPSLPTVRLDLIKHSRVDVLVHRAPHDLVHHLTQDSNVEIDLSQAELEVCDVQNQWVVADADVVHDGSANDLAADVALEIEGVHGVVNVE